MIILKSACARRTDTFWVDSYRIGALLSACAYISTGRNHAIIHEVLNSDLSVHKIFIVHVLALIYRREINTGSGPVLTREYALIRKLSL